MKKKLLISAVLALVLVCLFAIAVGATTYVYSDEDGNVLYSATAEFEGRNRYELINSESGSLAKTDADGNSLTWYVIADDNGTDVRNITVKSIETADAGVITDGKFTFTGDVTTDNVVSVNFFGLDIKTFDTGLFMTTAKTTPSGSTSEYCQLANGKYLLFLYLPKTLTEIPDYFCYRTSIRVLEWEDNIVNYEQFPEKAFQFCANLKVLIIPEGIEILKNTNNGNNANFRNCMSLSYVKFPSTMTELPDNVFFRCTQFETIVYGENMTKIGYLNSDYTTARDSNKITDIPLKYVYVPAKLVTSGGAKSQMFDSHRGISINGKGFNGNVNHSVVFYVYGDLDYVNALKTATDKNFSQRTTAIVDYQTYLGNKEYYDSIPDGSTPHVIVYGLTYCDMYTGGEHTMGTEIAVTAPTCTTEGNVTYECAKCKRTYSVATPIDKDAHVYDGADDIDCNICGLLKDGACVEHNYAETVTAPDCTNGGYTTYTCTLCGDTYVDNATDALGHTDGEAVIENNVDSDCVNGGSYETVVYCSVCKAELSRTKTTTEANGHSYDSVVTEPDCENNGYTTYTCSVCGDTYEDNKVDALGHTYVYTNTYKDALTSFEVGEVCSVCGTKGETTEYAPLLTYKGYSAQIDGDRVTVGYTVDKTTQAFLSNISYGVLIAVPNESDDLSAYEPVNPDLTISGTSTAVLRTVNKKYDSFNLFVDGFEESNYDKNLVLCAFVTDGTNVDYLCANESNEVSQQEYAAAVTFAEIAEACNPKYEITFTCDETMGTLEGETSQTVRVGENTTTVTATANEGYTFACWSDGTQTPEITVTAEKKATLTASFVPNSTGLPVMTINTETGEDVTTKEYYINCEITILDNTGKGDSVGSAVAEIKGRGNSTWNYDKKPYKFKFDKKQDLFGYGSEKTWVLLADARDYSLLRNMLALNAGLTMSELGYVSKGQSVELYLNGEYRGVYYLCEQIQVKENRVNITTEDDGKDLDGDGIIDPDSIGYLLEMDAWAADGSNKNLPNYTKDGDVFVTFSKGCQHPYVIKDPEDIFFDEDGNFDAEKSKPYLDYVSNYLQECRNAFNLSKTHENYEKVCELVDVKSFAQAYIIYDLFKHADTNYSSVYFYKDAYGKLVAAPLWDFDMAVGNVTHKSGAGSNAQNFRDTTTLWTKDNNWFYNQLCQFPEFQALVYEELVANKDAIMGSIANDLAYAKAHADAYKKNFEKWDLIGNVDAPEAWGNWSVPVEFREFETWEEHLVYIENYLNASYAYLLEHYKPATAE